uniref:Uncharacterized protein n=1 Tax=Panagrolaimus sp. ES5 TaxID=591445 RepID=A0AC34G0E4_9BILA
MNCREEQISQILSRYRPPSTCSYALERNIGYSDSQIKGEYVFDKYEQTWHASTAPNPESSWLQKIQNRFNKR